MTTCHLGVKQTQIGRKLSAMIDYFDNVLINYSYTEVNLSFECQKDSNRSKFSAITNIWWENKGPDIGPLTMTYLNSLSRPCSD